MEFMFDSASLDDIRTLSEAYPITGVTSNPSILKAEGKIDFFPRMRDIRSVIGMERSLHIQTIAENFEDILREADAILQNVDDKVYIKVPANEEGLKAMRCLKAEGHNVTATAIYTKMQGFMAIAAGVDFIAPYCNRMENMGIHFADNIAAFAAMVARNSAPTKILAASFRNIAQVNDALLAGAHAATLPPALLREAFRQPCIQAAVDGFHRDWVSIYGEVSITDLA